LHYVQIHIKAVKHYYELIRYKTGWN